MTSCQSFDQWDVINNWSLFCVLNDVYVLNALMSIINNYVITVVFIDISCQDVTIVGNNGLM